MTKVTGFRLQVSVFLSLLFAVTCNLLPTPSYAHFVKSDAGIGAVLHVDPGDDPVAREQSNIIFEFKDTANKFNLSSCDCRITITKAGQEIFSDSLNSVGEGQDLSSVTPFTFPEKNIYQIKISGASKDRSYDSFELKYDVRVARETDGASLPASKPDSLSLHWIHLGGGAVIIGLLIFALIKNNKQNISNKGGEINNKFKV